MDKIKWCIQAKGGIELIDANDNLAEAYIKKAEEALESLSLIRARDWKISTAYYSMYFSLYSIMMKIGVKCEIHACTVAFMKRFLCDYFDNDEIVLLEESSRARIDAQYYVSRNVLDETFEKMVKNASLFLVKCKSVLLKMDENSVGKIRKELSKLTKNK